MRWYWMESGYSVEVCSESLEKKLVLRQETPMEEYPNLLVLQILLKGGRVGRLTA